MISTGQSITGGQDSDLIYNAFALAFYELRGRGVKLRKLTSLELDVLGAEILYGTAELVGSTDALRQAQGSHTCGVRARNLGSRELLRYPSGIADAVQGHPEVTQYAWI